MYALGGRSQAWECIWDSLFLCANARRDFAGGRRRKWFRETEPKQQLDIATRNVLEEDKPPIDYPLDAARVQE